MSVVLGAVRAFQMPAQQALTPLLVPADAAAAGAGLQFGRPAGRDHRRPGAGRPDLRRRRRRHLRRAARCCSRWPRRCALAIRYEHAPAAGRARRRWQTLLAGVRFVVERKVVLGAISLDLFAVLLGGATALLPIFAKDILHVGPWGLGLLRARAGGGRAGDVGGAVALAGAAAQPAACCWARWRSTAWRCWCSALSTGVRGCRWRRWRVERRGRHGQRGRSARRWCSWRRPTPCAAASARSTRCSSAPPTSSASSSPAPSPRGSGRWRRSCSAASGPASLPSRGGAFSRTSRGATGFSRKPRQAPRR
ncbi:MAG: hypothetical protein MZW92_43125 [Comamonadaceae bacterium]|nr:hypothetical protein [Comamonadaceae bacterium]